MGSLLRIIAIIPLSLLVLELRTIRIRWSPGVVLPLLFWLLAVVSLFYSINPERSMTSVATLTMNLFLVLALGNAVTYSRAEVQLLWRAMLGGTWFTVFLLLLYSDFSLAGRLTLQQGAWKQDHNYLYGYLLYGFSFHMETFLKEKKIRHLVCAGLLYLIAFATGSRGGVFAFAAVLLLHLFVDLRRQRVRKKILRLCLVAACAVLLAMLAVRLLPQSVVERYSFRFLLAHGTTGRTGIWRSLLQHFSRDSLGRMLFGHGYGTTASIQSTGKVAHNLYLDNLMALGIFGVLLQIALQIVYLVKMRKQQIPGLFGAYAGYLVMCCSLSLVSYRPIWNAMMLSLIASHQKNADPEAY